MPDYIYLLENRLSPQQRDAIRLIREVARDSAITVFLTGGAVRDLTTGSPVRDLDFTVQGNALDLKSALAAAGALYWGEHTPSRTLFLEFPGHVRVEVSSAHREEFPKPGRPEYFWDTILEDLRRRDFTANAMALSLNDMSYGLLMDPLNGVADIESRTLRLVSNYGFLESPVRMVRAARLLHRLQWVMDDKTATRLQNAKDEGMMQQLSDYDKGYELEEIGHEENPLATLKALEAEGWMKEMFPAWTASCADLSGLDQMHEVLTRLQMQGVYPDASSAAMELLTAKMKPAELTALKKKFVRQGFVKQWESLEKDAQEFAARLTAKEASTPSATWKLFQTSNPSAVLWLGLTGKGVATQNKYKNFFSVWPEAKTQVPTLIMQEMRITPELPAYAELLEQYFYAVIDGKLKTEEEIRAFLEPYSPPAPPPPVTIKRGRASKKSESKKSSRSKTEKGAGSEEDGESVDNAVKDDGENESPAEVRDRKPTRKAADKEAVAASANVTAPPVHSKDDSIPASVVKPAKAAVTPPPVKASAAARPDAKSVPRVEAAQAKKPQAAKSIGKQVHPAKKANSVSLPKKTANKVPENKKGTENRKGSGKQIAVKAGKGSGPAPSAKKPVSVTAKKKTAGKPVAKKATPKPVAKKAAPVKKAGVKSKKKR